jgi:hypothetical protein
MRRLLVVVMLLALAGSAMAANVGVRPEPKPDGVIYEGGGRVGGDNVGSAVVIGSLPYYDSGNTCGFVNDYDEICPYSGSTSPDVVYVYYPAANQAITVNLCDSAYDTKVYIYQNAVGGLIACNDDASCGYSGWQSLVENVALVAGNTYYIVVDGYGGSCGDYVMSVEGFQPCVVDCPAGAIQEGEPPCVDNYNDQYNGGCNSTGWTVVEATGGGCADVCGKSCTYIYQGLSYRDTDWYTMNALAAGNVNASCEAEFPLQFILIYGANCANLQYTLGTAGPCTPVNLSWYFGAGAEFWLWVGASVFSGIPESDYTFNVCNIEGGPVPVENKSWGAIKNSYR